MEWINLASIYPGWEDIDRFHNKLTDGEYHITEYLHSNLSDEWEIYVQPFLNGSRPDIILLSHEFGVIIIEVKDWILHNYYFKVDEISKKNELYVKAKNGKHKILNPIDQVEHYSDKLETLIPTLESKVNKHYKLIRKIIYFHKESQFSVDEFFPPIQKWNNKMLVGIDGLHSENLKEFIYMTVNKEYNLMDDETLEHIRTWVQPPFHFKEQCKPIDFNNIPNGNEIKKHSEPNPGSHRIRGVAGSGKTLVVAYRAAKLAKEHRVLIVTYNKTLWHYIHDNVARAPFDFERKNIVYSHFHEFCNDILTELNHPKPYDKDDENFYLNNIVSFVNKALGKCGRNGKNIDEYKYDAILIDEAQDFEAEWIDLLRKFLKGRKELLIVCDEAQNVYGRNMSWTDNEGIKRGFIGPWGKLSNCIRLPKLIAEEANRFAYQYLPDVKLHPVPTQTKLFEFDPILRWIPCENNDEIKDQVEAAYDYLTNEIKQQPSDIVVLFQNIRIGKEMVERFENNKHLKVNHVFDGGHKNSFWMGVPRIKMSTIHSFKGMELKNVIVVVTAKKPSEIYTAISRTMQNLIVINHVSKYDEYGKSWPSTDPFQVAN
ncbi:UvrD-helicase domain-containing protein [Methanolobus sp. WCC5]|uniref:UvrD-helicase domain-containing protein n=1 Tax=Methanolobus sp. WCC5 TaxID=3125785 RepID=UPI003253B4A2